MNYILLRRRHTPLRFIPLQISMNDEQMVKFVTYWKETMQKSMGVSFIDSEPRCPIREAQRLIGVKDDGIVGPMTLRHLKELRSR